MPPSAMTATPVPRSAFAALYTAVSCGMPTPHTSRVVHIEHDVDLREVLHDVLRHLHDALGVAVRGIDYNAVDTGVRELLHARKVALPAGNRRGNPETELVVAVVGRIRVLDDARDVREAVETHDAAVLVNERKLADFRGAHEVVRLLEGGSGL